MGESRFSVEKNLSQEAVKIVREAFCAVFQKFPGREKFKDKRGGISRFSVEKFLSHSAKNFRRGDLL